MSGAEGEIRLDFARGARTGIEEAILCERKGVAQLVAILEAARERGARLLLTRLDASVLAALPPALVAALDYEPVSRTAWLGGPARAPLRDLGVRLVCAGTSDLPAGREAVRTLAYYGVACPEINDVGVAGLWRLLERGEEIRASRILIVAAGMDAALASVVGGLVAGVVIALPTSTGYGMAQGGETALRAMLVSCAPGVTVVNIDNGFGAACAALRVLNPGLSAP